MRRKEWVVGGVCAAIVVASAWIIVRAIAVRRPEPRAAARIVDDGIATDDIRQPNGLSCSVYVPFGLDRTQMHPMVFAASPSGVGREALSSWKNACDELGIILVASDNFRNGAWSDADDARQLETLTLVMKRYPIDRARVFASGFSGSGMHAHDLVADHPDIFRGVVANTGMMPHHLPRNAGFDAGAYPRDKIAVLIASPHDFRYREMQEDRALLLGIGWKVKWIEVESGHQWAAPGAYVEAARWMLQQ